ncbi:MAG: hypothetical protein WD904_03820 [Dehalococcoidia bacterium]
MKALIVLFAVALSGLAACGGDDDDTSGPTAVITPAGTKDETPTPAPDGGGPAPSPADPQLDEDLQELTSGELEATIEPGGTYEIDPLAITETAGGSAPPCENFAFDFTWQVTDPYPSDGVQLVWRFIRDEGDVDIANAPSGEQTIGCGLLRAVNNGGETITVAVRYRVGAIP